MEKAVLPITWVFGVVFVAVGLLGFVTGNPLLWFQIDNVHNVIHLASGIVAFIAASSGYAAARWYLIIFGLVYGLVTLLGFLNDGNVLGIIQVNQADNYLHLAITLGTLGVGFLSPAE